MSRRLDHALQDSTRLQFLVPGREPPEGLVLMKADLTRFFALVADVGRDEALLLLTIRAFRIRDNLLDVSVNDLAVALRTSNRRVIRWLDRLVAHRLVVYNLKSLPLVQATIDRARVEFIGPSVADLFDYRVHQELPTHLFESFLPLRGRVTFTVYLYVLWSEVERPYLDLDHLVETVRLRGRLHGALHVRRLRRSGLLVLHPEGDGLIVRDPSPPTKFERLLLRYLAIPSLRRSVAHLVLLSLGGVLLVALLLLVLHLFA
jgi:hypothetical protein